MENLNRIMYCFGDETLRAVQVKWFVRLVLKDMRLGVGQNTILGQVHPDARELYDVNASLKKVCQTLRDPTVRYKLEISSSFKCYCQCISK